MPSQNRPTLEEMARRDMERAIAHGKVWDDIFAKLFDPPRPRFARTFCSQCGGEFGAGDSGYSHCDQHE